MAVKFRDYYEVLGVPRHATAEEIKRAYRKLARKHHPDLHAGAEKSKAAERFKEINEANEVLKDAEKRKRYDALGENWKSGMDFTPPPGSSSGAGAGDQWQDLGDLGDVSDFFASVFGRGVGGNRRTSARGARAGRSGVHITMPGNDVEAELAVTLEDMLQGGKRRIQLPGGRNLDVDLPVGVRDGTALRLAGQGEPGFGDGPPGDLYLRVRLAPHPRYRVVGDDLEMDLPLWPWQAVLGASVRIETADGAVKLTVPAGTQSDARLRLRGRGLPRSAGERGDLFAVARVVIPEHPTEQERAVYEALQRAAAAPADRPAEG